MLTRSKQKGDWDCTENKEREGLFGSHRRRHHLNGGNTQPVMQTVQGGDSKRVSDPPELESQTFMICHVGAENKPGFSGRAAIALNCQAISLALQYFRINITLIAKYKNLKTNSDEAKTGERHAGCSCSGSGLGLVCKHLESYAAWLWTLILILQMRLCIKEVPCLLRSGLHLWILYLS